MKGFTGHAVILGARRAMPLLMGIAPFGLVAGVMAQGQGLTVGEAGLMSGLVFAGSAQIVALSHWAAPAPVLAASLAAFVVNLRLALMGPVLAPWLDRLRGWRLLISLFVMADQNWALSVEAMRRGESDAGFLFGSGVTLWLAWLLSTLAGHELGRVMAPVPGHPLFFAALAAFVSMLVPMWRGWTDAIAWLVAAACSTMASFLLPGTWYIIIGALAGSMAGLARDLMQRRQLG